MMMFNTIFAVDDDLLMRGLQLSFLSKQLVRVSLQRGLAIGRAPPSTLTQESCCHVRPRQPDGGGRGD